MDFLAYHGLRRHAELAPEQVALIDGERSWTFADAWNQVRQWAHSLQAAGLKRFDRVGVLLPHGADQALALLAVSASQAAFVPIHASLHPAQIAHIVEDAEIRHLISAPRFADRLREAHLLLGDRHLEIWSIEGTAASDTPLAVEHRGWKWHELPARKNTDRDLAWRERLAIDKDLAGILYTSGSTGKPKGVMVSHANLLAGARIVSSYLDLTSADRILSVLPFSFDAGLNQWLSACETGAALITCPFVLAKQIVGALHAHQITGLAGVPTMWSLLARSDSFRNATFPHLRYVTNTGGKLPLPVLATLRATLASTQIYLMYGLTEAFRSTYLPPEELDRRPESIGKAIPNTEILVLDDTGRVCGPGEVGELVHHGPTVSMGYWQRPDDTARVLRPHPLAPPGLPRTELVCYSGDLVTTDSDGFLYFVGRRDHQIKTSGFRVSPTEVEDVLYRHPQVALAAVIGVPDEHLGERIVAWIVPRAGSDLERLPDELRAIAGDHLPSHLIPREILSCEQLPWTAHGKIDYAALRRAWPQHPLDRPSSS